MTTIRALMAAEGLSYSGAYKRLHPEKAREYAKRDNAKRTKVKQESWRGTCSTCGGQTSRRDVTTCAGCTRVPSAPTAKIPLENQIDPATVAAAPGHGKPGSGS